MKRLLSILLIVLLVLPMTALAEEPFTLRNGYYWGMSKAEAMKLAQEEGIGFSTEPMFMERNQDQSFPELYYENVSVGQHSAYIFSLHFQEGNDHSFQLYEASYGIMVSSAEYASVLQDIALNLTTLYGIPVKTASGEPLRLTWRTGGTIISLKAMDSFYETNESPCFLFIFYQQSDASSRPAIKDGGF